MSSKVFAPDQPVDSSAVPWRLVHSGAAPVRPAPPKEPVKEPQPDIASITAQLEQQWDQRVKEARTAGLREGEATGRNKALAEMQPVIERMTGSIAEVARLGDKLRREAEADMLKLSLAIARRVLRRELVMDPEALHGVVLAALEKLQVQEICRVRVHPSHAASIGATLAKLHPELKIQVVPDPTREPGALVFETERGDLDASVDTQLQAIERGLADRLRSQSK
jgi:flagellar assembly protein FliH